MGLSWVLVRPLEPTDVFVPGLFVQALERFRRRNSRALSAPRSHDCLRHTERKRYQTCPAVPGPRPAFLHLVSQRMSMSCKRRDKRFRPCSYILRSVPNVVATSRGSEHLPAERSVPCAIDRFDPGLVIPAVSAIEQILDGQIMPIEPCLLFGGSQILFDDVDCVFFAVRV